MVEGRAPLGAGAPLDAPGHLTGAAAAVRLDAQPPLGLAAAAPETARDVYLGVLVRPAVAVADAAVCLQREGIALERALERNRVDGRPAGRGPALEAEVGQVDGPRRQVESDVL